MKYKCRKLVLFIIMISIFVPIARTYPSYGKVKNKSPKIISNFSFTQKDKDEAVKAITLYKTSLFNIPDYKAYEDFLNIKSAQEVSRKINDIRDLYRPFFTDKGLDKIVSNKIPILYIQLAWEMKYNMKFKKLTIKKIEYVSKTKRMFIDYTASAEITNADTAKNYDQEGQAGLELVDGKWKIFNDTIFLTGTM